MYNHILYFLYWLINFLVLYLFSRIFPGSIVLGNYRFSSLESAIYAGFWLTFFVWVFWDFAIAKGLKFDTRLVTWGYFWLANSFAVWLVARFSHIAGFGIVNYLWAFAIGLVVFIFQRIIWKGFFPPRKGLNEERVKVP